MKFALLVLRFVAASGAAQDIYKLKDDNYAT
jgi:hypothetical protein